ncbi:MAG: hypothetical protein IKH15_08160 [Bacteroidales bacterium]|nr:hypothetical protein [Bacteroidales bacterium]MBR4637059.1 hypothetical protein [Bacteroidales bacterium]
MKLSEIYSNLHRTSFWICLIISILLIVTAFFVPPTAVVDGSVIAAVGEIFAFAALGQVAAAIERGRNVKVSKGNVSMSVGDDDEVQDSGGREEGL